jgi:RNA polymerase sigma factor (sigma-70 family)
MDRLTASKICKFCTSAEFCYSPILNALRQLLRHLAPKKNRHHHPIRVCYYVASSAISNREAQMTEQELILELQRFVNTAKARRLCRRYHVESRDALGALYLRLRPRVDEPIRNVQAWVSSNATGYLQNHLRRESTEFRHSTLDVEIERSAGDLCPAALRSDRRWKGKRFCQQSVGEPQTTLERQELCGRLDEAMESLPANEQAAVAVHAGVSGHSCRSMARRCGLSTQTVCNRAKRGERKLKVLLEGVR